MVHCMVPFWRARDVVCLAMACRRMRTLFATQARTIWGKLLDRDFPPFLSPAVSWTLLTCTQPSDDHVQQVEAALRRVFAQDPGAADRLRRAWPFWRRSCFQYTRHAVPLMDELQRLSSSSSSSFAVSGEGILLDRVAFGVCGMTTILAKASSESVAIPIDDHPGTDQARPARLYVWQPSMPACKAEYLARFLLQERGILCTSSRRLSEVARVWQLRVGVYVWLGLLECLMKNVSVVLAAVKIAAPLDSCSWTAISAPYALSVPVYSVLEATAQYLVCTARARQAANATKYTSIDLYWSLGFALFVWCFARFLDDAMSLALAFAPWWTLLALGALKALAVIGFNVPGSWMQWVDPNHTRDKMWCCLCVLGIVGLLLAQSLLIYFKISRATYNWTAAFIPAIALIASALVTGVMVGCKAQHTIAGSAWIRTYQCALWMLGLALLQLIALDLYLSTGAAVYGVVSFGVWILRDVCQWLCTTATELRDADSFHRLLFLTDVPHPLSGLALTERQLRVLRSRLARSA